MEENKNLSTRIFVGGILILVGILLFLSINDMINFRFSHVVFSFPFFLFLIGILILINSRNRVFGTLLVLIGGFFLIPRIIPAIHFDGSLIFPLLLIGLGIAIIVKHRQPTRFIPAAGTSNEGVRKDYIDDVAVFGGGKKVLVTDQFKGGNITVVFGGSQIDLSRCQLAEGEHVLDVLMIFGGSDITVPREWNIIVNVTPLFGGFSNKLMRDPAVPIDTTRTLVIRGIALFGGGDVKNKF